MIQRLSFNNFCSRYIIDTQSKKLSKKDKTIALVASIILGVCTLWLPHAIVAIVRCKLDQREIIILSKPKVECVLKTKNKDELFKRLEKDGANVTELDLRYAHLNEKEIEKAIQLCPKATKIAIKTNSVSKPFLSSVQSLKKLQELDIHVHKNAVPSRRSIAQTFVRMPSMQRLSLQKSSPRLSVDEEQDTNEDIVELSLFSKEITGEELIERISSSPNLQKLEFQIGEVTVKLAKKIKELEHLEELGIDLTIADNPVMSKEAVNHLMQLPALTAFYLRIPKLSVPIATQLSKAEQLESLSLELSDAIQPHVATQIGRIKNLKKLSVDVMEWLENNNFFTSLFTNLSRLKSLEELTIKRINSVDKRAIAVLKGLKSLKVLSFPSIKHIDNEILREFGNIPNIKTIVLSRMKVKSDDQELNDLIAELESKGIEVVTQK